MLTNRTPCHNMLRLAMFFFLCLLAGLCQSAHAGLFGNMLEDKSQPVKPILSLQGNMSNAKTFEVAAMAAQNAQGSSVNLEQRPLVVIARSPETFNRLWQIFSSSVLAAEPVSKPKIDFERDSAILILPYESRGGGKPPTLRQIRFNPKKQQLLIEFDESDLFSKNKPPTRQAATSVMGSPWYFAVFAQEQLEVVPIIRVIDW